MQGLGSGYCDLIACFLLRVLGCQSCAGTCWPSKSFPLTSLPPCLPYRRAPSARPAPQSAKRLTGTMQWRKQVRPQEVVCRACAKDPRSHYMHLIGHCKLGRPIIYSCLELAKNKVFEDNRDHMIQVGDLGFKPRASGGFVNVLPHPATVPSLSPVPPATCLR